MEKNNNIRKLGVREHNFFRTVKYKNKYTII